MNVTGIYLFTNTRLWECRAAMRHLEDYDIQAIIIRTSTINMPILLIGLSKFYGLDEIKYAVDRLRY